MHLLMLIAAMWLVLCGPGFTTDASAVTPGQFNSAVGAVLAVPYNPRPIPTDTMDVTGVSEVDTRDLFLQNFQRVTISAPANGRTFHASVPGNAPDVTLVAYQRFHGGSPRP